MEASCRCLNVQLLCPAEAEESPAPAALAALLGGGSTWRLLRWARSRPGPAEGRQFPSLVAVQSLSPTAAAAEDLPSAWELERCLLCQTDLWARPLSPPADHLLLLSDALPVSLLVRFLSFPSAARTWTPSAGSCQSGSGP